jgi:hypothetical protein
LPENINTGTIYGAEIGFLTGRVFEVAFAWESQVSKYPKTSTSPSVADAGWALQQDELWMILNAYIARTNSLFVYFGGAGGYPLTSKATLKNATGTFEYEADKTIAYRGHVGVGVVFGKHFSLYLEGGYQALVSGDLKRNGATLMSGSEKAKMDLTGPRATAGLAFLF